MASFGKFFNDLTRFEEQDGNLAEVEVDEVLGLVGHVASEVTSDDAVPCWVVLFVELLLDVGSDVLFNVVLLQSLGGAVHGILLHVLRHISILDHGFAVSHGDFCNTEEGKFLKHCGVRVFVLFNDAWSQKGHSASYTTAILTPNYKIKSNL